MLESRRAQLAAGVFGALGALGGGCGISLVGQAGPSGSVDDAAVGAGGDGADAPVTALDGSSSDGGEVEGGDSASGDAGKLDPRKVQVSYALGHDGKAYRLDLGTKTSRRCQARAVRAVKRRPLRWTARCTSRRSTARASTS